MIPKSLTTKSNKTSKHIKLSSKNNVISTQKKTSKDKGKGNQMILENNIVIPEIFLSNKI